MEQFLNYLLIFAFCLSCADLVAQIRHVNRRKETDDISVFGALARFVAVNVLLVKYVVVGDKYLLFGQVAFNALLFVYTVQVVIYQKANTSKNTK
jgi:hypothetical protein